MPDLLDHSWPRRKQAAIQKDLFDKTYPIANTRLCDVCFLIFRDNILSFRTFPMMKPFSPMLNIVGVRSYNPIEYIGKVGKAFITPFYQF